MGGHRVWFCSPSPCQTPVWPREALCNNSLVTEWLTYRQRTMSGLPTGQKTIPVYPLRWSLPCPHSPPFPPGVTISWQRAVGGKGAEMVLLFPGSEPPVQRGFFLIEYPLTLEGPLASGALPLSGGASSRLGSASFQVGRPSGFFHWLDTREGPSLRLRGPL